MRHNQLLNAMTSYYCYDDLLLWLQLNFYHIMFHNSVSILKYTELIVKPFSFYISFILDFFFVLNFLQMLMFLLRKRTAVMLDVTGLWWILMQSPLFWLSCAPYIYKCFLCIWCTRQIVFVLRCSKWQRNTFKKNPEVSRSHDAVSCRKCASISGWAAS